MAEKTVGTSVSRVVDALVGGGLVPPDRSAEAQRVVASVIGSEETAPVRVRARFGEIAGYVGAALVLAAGVLFLSQEWSNLTQGERVAWVGGMSIVLGVVGLVIAFVGGGFEQIREPAGAVRRRLSGTVLTGMAVTAAIAAALQADRFNPANEAWLPFAAFTTLAVAGMIGYLVAPTVVGQAPVAVGAFGAVVSLVDALTTQDRNFVVATALFEIALAVLWWGAAEVDFWKPREVGLIGAFGIGLLGAQMPVMNSEAQNLGYLLTALVVVAAFGGYVLRPAWPYLGAGVVAVTLVVPEAITDWTAGSITTAGAVLLAGVTLLAASLASFRLHSESHRGEKPRRTPRFHRPHPSGA